MFNYNPYMNPYTPQQNTMPVSGSFGTRQEIVKVNGEGGARAYQLAPNSSILLLDETEPVIWLKTSDGAGYPNLIPYTITPKESDPVPDFKSLEQRISKLEGMMIHESDIANVKQSIAEQYTQSDKSNTKYDTRQKH